MTALAILIGGLGVMLLWSGITGKSWLDEFKATLLGTKKLPAK